MGDIIMKEIENISSKYYLKSVKLRTCRMKFASFFLLYCEYIISF